MLSLIACTFKDNILVPVAVMPSAKEGAPPQLVCPPFFVPVGKWRIVWNLVTIDEAEPVHATFPDQEGIRALFGSDSHFSSPERISDTQWAVWIDADNKDALVRPIPYEVSFFYSAPGENKKLFTSQDRRVIRHDPSIVVSKDPIEPPIG